MTGKIKLVHSGGNAVSLAVPTSNPSSSEVEFKLPQADGTSGQALVTDASGNLSFAGTGKILQVSHTKQNSIISITKFSNYIWIISSITPSSSSNKVFVHIALFQSSNCNNYGMFNNSIERGWN